MHLPLLPSLRTLAAACFRRASVAAQAPCAAGPAASGDTARSVVCGWFDSSHELQQGLWVQEHATPDTLAQELPLAQWLELHLAGRCGAPAGHMAT